eukprot:TRINITY_DN1832_c0_g1_i2.p1 TRINITY_DN1832_c0_g1~~TRINITY_DN1832_c0_g1_i2.p1  ORF type:complete len:749 (-),score=137.94 TRINITY_DN1832_c0_g1_i2:1336-3480(-)
MAALYGGGLQCAYTREREIGTGHFGRVYAARDASGRLCAMKVVPQESVRTQQAIHYLRDEAENLRKASHPNICKFIECGKVNREYCIVMELCAGGSMRQLLDKYNTGFPEVHVCKWTRQIASALQWLHSLKIMHRDLNPNNILFSTIDWRVADIKICDFGISKFCPQGITASALGTPIYCAPELRKQMAYNDKCDLYSLGATLHEMLQGPFDSEQVGRVASFKLPPLSVPCSAAAKDLVDKLLKPESERLDWRQLLEHPYISGACVAVALLRAGAPPTATSCICFTATDLQPLTQDCSMEIIPREFTHQNLQQSLRRVSEFEAVAHAATEEYVHRIVWCAFLPKPAVLQSIITAEPAYSGHQAALHQNSESLQLEAENVLEDVEKILELCHNTYVLLGVLELHAISLRKKLKDKLAERTREWNQRQLRFDVFRACKLSAVSDHARRLVVVADLPATFPPSEAQKGLLSLSERELPSEENCKNETLAALRAAARDAKEGHLPQSYNLLPETERLQLQEHALCEAHSLCAQARAHLSRQLELVARLQAYLAKLEEAHLAVEQVERDQVQIDGKVATVTQLHALQEQYEHTVSQSLAASAAQLADCRRQLLVDLPLEQRALMEHCDAVPRASASDLVRLFLGYEPQPQQQQRQEDLDWSFIDLDTMRSTLGPSPAPLLPPPPASAALAAEVRADLQGLLADVTQLIQHSNLRPGRLL